MKIANRLKIAIVTHNIIKRDGQGRVNCELVKYLAARGHEVHLYANRVDQDLLALNNVVYHHIRIFIERPHLVKGIIFLLVVNWRLWNADYDIVHLNGSVSLASYDVNTCHFCHSAWVKIPRKIKMERGVKEIYYFVYTWLNAWLEKIIYHRRKGLVIAVSNKVKTELMNKAGISKKKIKVIYNGVDIEEFNEKDRSECEEFVIREFNLGEDDFLILFAGDIRTNRKGVGYLLKSLKDLNSNKVKLLIAGNNTRSPFVKKMDEDGLSEKVKFIGFRNDLDKIFKGVQAFVLPTIYDPCPVVILQAMASGVPIIISHSGYCGASELIKDMENGILLRDPTNSKEIREKIRLLLSDKELRETIGKNARSTAENFSWEKMAEDYEKIYFEILEDKRKLKR